MEKFKKHIGKALCLVTFIGAGIYVTQADSMGMMGVGMHHSMNMDGHMGNHGESGAYALQNATQEARPLAIPPLLSGEYNTGTGERDYTLVAQQGESSIKDGEKTKTYGYNGSLLGPTLFLKKGEKVALHLKNTLPEETSFHWHGLVVQSDVDGGPHSPIAPNGGTGTVRFTLGQDGNTSWYHPHAMGTTASQVYEGLAGVIIVDDGRDNDLHIPHEYGVTDIPVVIQDRSFTKDNQWDYEKDHAPDGVYGNTLVVNGTINPYFEVKSNVIRLRLLNGSNARNYKLALDNGAKILQIASDGGLLNKPVEKSEITLVPGERAEVLVDFSNAKDKLPSLVTEDGRITVLQFKKSPSYKEGASLPSWDFHKSVAATSNLSAPDKKIVLSGMSHHVTINGKQFDMDRVDLTSKVGSTEIWEVSNVGSQMMSMIHPFHIHGVQFEVLTRNGKAVSPWEAGLKDTIEVKPGESVRIKMTFTQKGLFMIHCHILEHEENGMMLQLKVE